MRINEMTHHYWFLDLAIMKEQRNFQQNVPLQDEKAI